MAIKGKKKSQSRGSQARRRPAAAPRPSYATGGPKLPWYKTPGGQVAAGVGLALIAGLIVWAFATVRSGAADREGQQDAVEKYTGEIKVAAQLMNADVAEMNAIPLDAATLPEDLDKDVKLWNKAFTNALTQVSQMIPPPELEEANQLFGQAIQMYMSAADGYELAAKTEDTEAASALLAQFSKQRDQAAGIWQTAIAVLDRERDDLEMTSSRLTPPGMGAVPQPSGSPLDTTQIEVPPIDEGSGEGSGGGGDGGGKGGGKKGNK